MSGRLSSRSRTLRPAAINLVATRKPLEILQQLRIPRLPQASEPSDPAQAEWVRLAALPNLWFVRRRNLAYRDDLAGEAIRVAGHDTFDTDAPRLAALGLDGAANRVLGRATPRAALEVRSLLSSPRFAESPSLTAAALGELGRAETLDQAAVLRVAADLSAPGVGEGLARLERSRPETVPSKAALKAIADGSDWRATDVAATAARTSQLSGMARTALRPQPIRTAEPAQPAPAARATARQRDAETTTAAGERAATTPSGKRRKPVPAADAGAPTGKPRGSRK